MTTQANPYPRVESLINTVADWIQHRRELDEMRRLDRSEFNRIAGDLRISSDDLDELVRKGPHAADELPQLLHALGIDEGKLANTQPLLLRDMERVCALCQHKRQCEHDLAAGRSAAHYTEYCLNAPTIAQFGPIKGD